MVRGRVVVIEGEERVGREKVGEGKGGREG